MISPPPRSRSMPNSSTAATGDTSPSLGATGFAIFGLLSGAILKFQSCFARRVRQRLDTPVIPQPTTVEHDLGDFFCLCVLRGELTHLLRPIDRTLRTLQFGRYRAGGCQGYAFHVIDKLDINMFARKANTHPWALCR